MNTPTNGLTPTSASDLIRALMWALESGDFASADAALLEMPERAEADIREFLLAFDGHCEDPADPSWKLMTRVAASAVRAGFFRLAERAIERLSDWPVGLPQVYAEAVQLSLACARLDLAAAFVRKLIQGFANHPATAVASACYREARELFARVAALGEESPEVDERPTNPLEDLGRSLLAAGKPAEALATFLRIAGQDDPTPSTWGQIAEAYRDMGQVEAAARAYRRVLSPDAPSVWFERLGDIHLAGGNPHVAIRSFGLCSYRNTHDLGVRRKLAQATGRLWRDRLKARPWTRSGQAPRYFDCFMFNGEFDLARMRFTELWDNVERFVVVEAAETFTGNPKPLMFKENIPQFEPFREKIVHVVVDAFPACCEYPWAKDFYQRDALVKGLDGLAADDDFVVIADADELWRWDVVSRFDGEVATMRMRMAKNFLNYQPVGTGRANRDTAAIARYRLVREHGASAVRFNLGRSQRKRDGFWLDDAGWHFHAIGDEQFIQYKFSSYAHREHHNKPDLVEVERVRARLDRLRASEHEPGWTAVTVGPNFPGCLQRDAETYRHLLLPSDPVETSVWIRRLSAGG